MITPLLCPSPGEKGQSGAKAPAGLKPTLQLLVADFGSRDAFLRFKANLRFSSFGSEVCELAQAFAEGALVGGLVAQIEGEIGCRVAVRVLEVERGSGARWRAA